MHPMRPRKTIILAPNAGTDKAQLLDWAGGAQVQFYNAGATIAFFKFGPDTNVVAAATDHPLPPGAIMVFSRDKDAASWLSVYAASSVQVYVTCGDGA